MAVALIASKTIPQCKWCGELHDPFKSGYWDCCERGACTALHLDLDEETAA